MLSVIPESEILYKIHVIEIRFLICINNGFQVLETT